MSSPTEEQLVARFQQLLNQDKKTAISCVKLGELHPQAAKELASDLPFDFEPPHDYITDVEERQHLFNQLREYIPPYVRLDSTILAIFMVCPLVEFRLLLGRLQQGNSAANLTQLLTLSTTHQGIAAFLAKPIKGLWPQTPSPKLTPEGPSKKRKRATAEVTPEVPSPLRVQVLSTSSDIARPKTPEHAHDKDSAASPSGSDSSGGSHRSSRNRTAVEKAKARDKNMCILTGVDSPDAAHIFPFSAGPGSGKQAHIAMLVRFWGDKAYKSWTDLYTNSSVTESAQNLLCLNKQLHLWWGSCRLALRPIRSLDPCVIKLQLHWLRRSATTPLAPVDGRIDDIRALWGDGDDSKSWGSTPVAHRRSGLPLETGQIFTVQAEKKEDLPSFELLEMQWNLLRVAAMSGAAEVEDDYYDDDEDYINNEYGVEYMAPYEDDNDVEEWDLDGVGEADMGAR